MDKRKTATTRTDRVPRREVIALIALSVALLAGVVLVITGATGTAEATGFVITVLAAAGWHSRPRR